MRLNVDLGCRLLDVTARQIIKHAAKMWHFPRGVRIDVVGDTVTAGCEAEVGVSKTNPLHFIIALDPEVNWRAQRFVEVVGHEVTHIKQYLFDGLNLEADVSTAKFRGQYFRFENELEYWLSPWEIEARGMQEYFVHMASTLNWGA